uniref:Uncharacterized protein n=1 Tax=Rhizophora mucronata TaxID=61149 RepID=A0A2P2PU94_RHIMU
MSNLQKPGQTELTLELGYLLATILV